MNKYGNFKAKDRNSRNGSPVPQDSKAEPSADSIGDGSKDNRKSSSGNPVRSEASPQQQAQTNAQPDCDMPPAAPIDKGNPLPPITPPQMQAWDSTPSVEQDEARDDADELEAEKARRHDESPSSEQRPTRPAFSKVVS